MKLLDLVLKEYISIVGQLEASETVTNDRIIIDKEYFKSLLEKYGYMKTAQKIKIYKTLNFIIYDKSYTLPVWLAGKCQRKVVFNHDIYTQIKELYQTEI